MDEVATIDFAESMPTTLRQELLTSLSGLGAQLRLTASFSRGQYDATVVDVDAVELYRGGVIRARLVDSGEYVEASLSTLRRAVVLLEPRPCGACLHPTAEHHPTDCIAGCGAVTDGQRCGCSRTQQTA